MKDGIVNTGEVACARRLVFFGAKSEGVYVDTGIGGTGVCLERLDLVKVGTFTFREAVLSVKLKLGNNNGVKTPAMHVKGSFTKDEGSGVRDSRSSSGSFGITVLEKTRSSDDSIVSSSRTECGKRVGKSINGISVVERLGTHTVEKKTVSAQRSAVVNVFVRLDNPNKFLTGMVEVELDLVG